MARKKPPKRSDLLNDLKEQEEFWLSVSIRMPSSLFWRLKRYSQDCNLGISAFAREALAYAMDQGVALKPSSPEEDAPDQAP